MSIELKIEEHLGEDLKTLELEHFNGNTFVSMYGVDEGTDNYLSIVLNSDNVKDLIKKLQEIDNE